MVVYPPPPPDKCDDLLFLSFFFGGGGVEGSLSAQNASAPYQWRTWHTSSGGASDLDELQGGMCTVADPGFSNRWGRKNPCAKRTARASYGWGPGARRSAPGGVHGQSPCWGPRGQSPRKLSSFQQTRAFKMVVRSDRNCNFSRCNFAYI